MKIKKGSWLMNKPMRLIGLVESFDNEAVKLSIGSEGERQFLYVEDLDEGWELVFVNSTKLNSFLSIVKEAINK